MNSIYNVAILLIAGLVFSRLLGKFKFPDVTGYLIAGIIIGPSVLGLLKAADVKSLEIVSTVALSFIAFSVGSEMDLKSLKKIGSKILLVTVFEALGAFFIVTLTMLLFFKTSIAFAITIGSIACATAPAATLMVIRQYKAKGDLVDVLIPVVALDDAICIIAFGICSSIATSLIKGSGVQVSKMLLRPILEIVFAFGLGAIAGLLYAFLMKKLRNDGETLTFTVGMVFLVTALSIKFELSSLLTLMVMGVTISNLGHSNRRYQTLINTITPPIFVCFFVQSGADLNIKNLGAVGVMGIAYVLSRVIGKVSGAYISTKMSGFSKAVQNNLGLTLVPQAGVAIGLSLIAANIIPSPYGVMIRSIVLGATIIYELVGPLLAKFALKRAGNIE